MKNHELLTRGEEVFLLKDTSETIGIREAVGTLAMVTYADFMQMCNETESETKKRLEEKISFQSKILDSLSRACKAINT